MASTLWMGNIHFGNITVAAKLHTAVSQNRIQFHLLHKTDGVKLRQQMVCKFEKTPVPSEEQVKGFQVDERKYVLIDPDELAQMEPESSRIIEVHEFVKTSEIDPVYFERTYYIEPNAESKSYDALAAAMKDMDVQGICTWVMRKRAYYGALRSTSKALVLTVLRYTDEILQAQSLGLEKFELSEKELSIGCELINKLTAKFQPRRYADEHQQKLRDLIEKKFRGHKILIFNPKRHKPTPPGKLLESLEKSLARVA